MSIAHSKAFQACRHLLAATLYVRQTDAQLFAGVANHLDLTAAMMYQNDIALAQSGLIAAVRVLFQEAAVFSPSKMSTAIFQNLGGVFSPSSLRAAGLSTHTNFAFFHLKTPGA